jgi:type IV pilus assembly protein PilV
MKKQYHSLKKNQGFTLLEALIGFLILSIGMLGIASLQAVSLQSGKSSVYGSVAMMKVDELIESMRANPTVLSDYTGTGANNACTASKKCTESELAQDDVFWWKKNLKAGLPGAATSVVAVTPPVAPSKMATVRVDLSWSERNKDASSEASSVSRTYSTTANICTEIPC